MKNCINCNKQFKSNLPIKKYCCAECRKHYLSHVHYIEIGKEKNTKIHREYTKKIREKNLEINLSKKRDLGFPENVDYEKPFTKVADGFGYLGVLLCDRTTGQVQCHICGGWFDWLFNHIKSSHKMNCDKYREKYGLLFKTALCSEKVRDSLVRRAMTFPWERMHNQGKMLGMMSKKGYSHNKKWRIHSSRVSSEIKNIEGTCELQIIDKLMKFSQKTGRQPKSTELNKKDTGVSRKTIVSRFGSVKEVRRILELQGYKYTVKSGIPLTDEVLLDSLRKFEDVYKRRPAISDIQRGLLPFSQCAYQKHFGKWSWAISKAFGDDYFALQHQKLLENI